MASRLLIGKVAGAHGIKGDVKIVSYADDANLLFDQKGVYTSETTRERVVLTFKSNPKGSLFIARLPGVADRNAAERANGTQFFIDREDLPELEDGYYHADLEGMAVADPAGKTLGTVLRVQNFGAGDLLDIKAPNGSTYYIPFAAPYLVGVDTKTRVITMTPPEVL